MKRLLLPAAIVFGALYFGSLPVRADVIYTLNTSNDTTVKTGLGACGGPWPLRSGRDPPDRRDACDRDVPSRPQSVLSLAR